MMHSTRTLATAPTPPRAALARRGRRLPSCSARHRRSRVVVVASFGLVLPGDDAFERLRPDARRRRRRGRGDRGDDGENERGRALARNGRDADANSWRGGESRRGSGARTVARTFLHARRAGIGVEAGVSSERFEVCSGYIGGRESALEMRVGGFAGLGEVEAFLRGVSGTNRERGAKAFGEYVVDGTPEWDIMEVWGVEEVTRWGVLGWFRGRRRWRR